MPPIVAYHNIIRWYYPYDKYIWTNSGEIFITSVTKYFTKVAFLKNLLHSYTFNSFSFPVLQVLYM